MKERVLYPRDAQSDWFHVIVVSRMLRVLVYRLELLLLLFGVWFLIFGFRAEAESLTPKI